MEEKVIHNKYVNIIKDMYGVATSILGNSSKRYKGVEFPVTVGIHQIIIETLLVCSIY